MALKIKLHRPVFYRYTHGNQPTGFQVGWNLYPQHWPIGAYIVLGKRCYCVKWGHC